MKHLKAISAKPALAIDDFWWNARLIIEPIVYSLFSLINAIAPFLASKDPENQS